MGNGRWNNEETEALCRGVERWGKRWSRIIQDPKFAAKLRGRSDGDCKDRWRTLEKAKQSYLAERSRLSLERAAQRSPSPPRLRRAHHRELIKTLKNELAERDKVERELRQKLAKTSAALAALEALHSSCPKLIQPFPSQTNASGGGKSRSDQAEHLVGWLSSLEAIAGTLPSVDLASDEARGIATKKMMDLTTAWYESNPQWTAPLAILEKLETTMNHVAHVSCAFEHLKASSVDARLSRKRPWHPSVTAHVDASLEAHGHKRRATALTDNTTSGLPSGFVTLPRLDSLPDMVQLLASASQSPPTNALASSSSSSSFSSKHPLPPDNDGEFVSAYLSKPSNWRNTSSDSIDAIEKSPNVNVESPTTDVSTCVRESADTSGASQEALEHLPDAYSPVPVPTLSARRVCPDFDSLTAAQNSLQMMSPVDSSQLSAPPPRDLCSLPPSESYPLVDDVPVLFSDGFVDFDDFDCEDIGYGSM